MSDASHCEIIRNGNYTFRLNRRIHLNISFEDVCFYLLSLIFPYLVMSHIICTSCHIYVSETRLMDIVLESIRRRCVWIDTIVHPNYKLMRYHGHFFCARFWAASVAKDRELLSIDYIEIQTKLCKMISFGKKIGARFQKSRSYSVNSTDLAKPPF